MLPRLERNISTQTRILASRSFRLCFVVFDLRRHIALSSLGLCTTASCSFGYEVLVGDQESAGGAGSYGGAPSESTGGDGSGAARNVTSGGAPDASTGGDDGGEGGLGGADPGPIVHCDSIRPLEDAPVLDGHLDPGMYLEEVTPVGFRATEMPPPDFPQGHEMHFAIGWRPNGLYFYVEIIDPDYNPALDADQVWMGDAVELFVDHDAVFETEPPFFDSVGTRQFFVASPSNDGTNSQRAEWRIPVGYYFEWEDGWIGVPTENGYAVEAFIDRVLLGLDAWSLSAGQRVGIDLAHDISLPPGQTSVDGNRLGQYFLQIADPPTGNDEDYPFNNEAVFCVATLISE